MPPTDLTAAVPAPDFTAYQAETAGIVLDSLAPATRRAYRIALAAVDDWHAGREPTDATGSSPLARGTRPLWCYSDAVDPRSGASLTHTRTCPAGHLFRGEVVAPRIHASHFLTCCSLARRYDTM